jgi:glycosyltransferase involved in cell wall biosynthesis
MEKYARYLELKSASELREVLSACDALLMPLAANQLHVPHILFLSMASSVYPIASHTPYTADILPAGRPVESAQVESFVSAVLELVRNRAFLSELQALARKRAEEKFDVRSAVEWFDGLYRTLRTSRASQMKAPVLTRRTALELTLRLLDCE